MNQFIGTIAEPLIFIASRAPSGLPEGILRVDIEGGEARTTAELMEAFATAFEFPEYFGRNWNAFYDCMADLDWCPPEGYAVVIGNADAVLVDEQLHPEFDEPSELAVLIDVLQRVVSEWNVPIDEGQPWDRHGIPFHVLFVADPDGVVALQDRIAASGREIPVFERF